MMTRNYSQTPGARWMRKRRAAAREAMNAKNREHRRDNPEKYKRIDRKQQLRKLYGLTPEDVEAKHREQRGRCAICAKEIPLWGRDCHVDHCHATGVFRGLLCQRCNVQLAPLENVEFRRVAEAYLSRATDA